MKKTIVLLYDVLSWTICHVNPISLTEDTGLSVVMLQALFLSDTSVIVDRTTGLNKEALLQWLCLCIKHIFKSITDIVD